MKQKPGKWIAISAATICSVSWILYVSKIASSPDRPPTRKELHILEKSLHDYHAEYRKYPAGSHQEIIDALTGNNERNISFLNLRPDQQLSSSSFKDAWGNPYVIEITPDSIILGSVGPDGKRGTTYDVFE